MEMQKDYSFYNLPRYKLTLSLATALFFMLFLLIFQPFGINNYSVKRIFTLELLGILSAVMLVILGVLLINEFLLRRWFIQKVTLGKIIGWSSWTCLLLGLSIFLFYNWLGGWHDFSFSSAVEFVVDITTVAVFPMVGTFFYFRYKNLHKALQQVVSNKQEYTDHYQLIHFEGQGINDDVTISIADFIYGRAQDNYVELVHRKNDRISKTLIRIPLSALSEKISSKMIVKCHRSFMVNLYHVRAITKGTRMELFLNYMDTPIPVSKSYRQEVDAHLKQVKNFI